MVLSINADLQAELERADTRPVYLVEVYPRPYPADSGETVWPNSLVNAYPIRFCWSDSPLVSAPASRGATIFREQTRIPNIIKTINLPSISHKQYTLQHKKKKKLYKNTYTINKQNLKIKTNKY